jgi:superfamily II RNA helicase
MFATETFAVGINMPTKTVVFLDYKKYDDKKENLRVLRTDEYIQMAGRAGRRGIDTLGTVIYLPVRTPLSLEEVKRMMTGSNTTLTSRMSFGYEFILKSLHSGVTFDEIIRNSHYKFQIDQENERLLKENERLINLQTDLNLNEYLTELHKRHELETSLKTKEIQRELSIWNNRHVGPKWSQAIKSYTQWLKYHHQIKNNLYTIANSEVTPLEANLEFLSKTKFILEENGVYTLTKKGVLATEINESHPLLLTESYSMGLLDHLSHKEICGFLSIFINKPREDVSNEINSIVLEKCIKAFNSIQRDFERKAVPNFNNEWLVTLEWINHVMDWIDGKMSQLICQEYDIFPGNLYKSIMSVSNMVEELITVSTLDQNVVMLETLLVRGAHTLINGQQGVRCWLLVELPD